MKPRVNTTVVPHQAVSWHGRPAHGRQGLWGHDHHGQHARATKGPGGFTLIELMIVVAIIGVLVAIVAPATTSAMETARRLRCRSQLKDIHRAMVMYGEDHNGRMPLAAGSDPLLNSVGAARIAAPTGAAPTPVSASLWLLLHEMGLPPQIFICPTTAHVKDLSGPLEKDTWDFEASRNLSYAMQCPYGTQTYYSGAPAVASQMPVLADRGPYFGDRGDLSAMPGDSAEAIDKWLTDADNRAKVNSANHHGAGQNVVFMDNHVEWAPRPTVGPRSDNIYTLQEGDTPAGRQRGQVPISAGSPDNRTPAGPLDCVLLY